MSDREATRAGQGRLGERGGAVGREPTQKTPKGLEIPVPKRREVIDALRKLVQPAKKP